MRITSYINLGKGSCAFLLVGGQPSLCPPESFMQEIERNEKLEERDKQLPPDSLGLLVQDLYREAASDRLIHEEVWDSAWHAWRGEFKDVTTKAVQLAKERGIYVNLTRRKVQEARVKLTNSILQNGKVPFRIKPSRRPRFLAPDLLEMDDPYEAAQIRAINCEQRIRDILDKSDYESSILKAINEQTLYGTACTKSIVLKTIDYPLYTTARRDPLLEVVEEAAESELVPHVEWVSIWDIFPSPGANSKHDLDWCIQRKYVSANELRELAERSGGQIDPNLIEECIQQGEGYESHEDGSPSPSRYYNHSTQVKKYCLLELWHKGLGKEDIRDYMEVDVDQPVNLSVTITVLGNKVLRAIPNPFERRIPFDFAYWMEQEDSIWGSGIYESIRDDQAMMNFIYGLIIEGKTMSSQPMVAINPNAFDASSDDFYELYPGKIFRLKSGESVNDAFKSIIIPDVTQGLTDLIKMIERNTDLSSGQVPIGMGSGAANQTKTATGMTILDQNSQRLTLSVVRSLNEMINHNINAIYHWLIADDPDISIKGDFEAQAKSYDQFMAREVSINQIMQFIQVLGQVPELRPNVNFSKLARPLQMGFGLDIDGLVRTEEEVQQEMMGQAEAEKKRVMDEAQAEVMKKDRLAVTEEKQNLGADIRKGIIQERLARIKEGDPVDTPIDQELESTSIILLEEINRLNAQREQQAAAEQGTVGVPPESEGGSPMAAA